MDVFINICEGVVAAVFGTMMWLAALAKLLSPKIEIARQITRGTTQDDEPCYRVKITNVARRAAIDLRFEFVILYDVASGATHPVTRRAAVPKTGREPLILPGNHSSQDHDYSVRYGADLPERVKQHANARMRMRVFARDSVSGVGKVFEYEYEDPEAAFVDGAATVELDHEQSAKQAPGNGAAGLSVRAS